MFSDDPSSYSNISIVRIAFKEKNMYPLHRLNKQSDCKAGVTFSFSCKLPAMRFISILLKSSTLTSTELTIGPFTEAQTQQKTRMPT